MSVSSSESSSSQSNTSSDEEEDEAIGMFAQLLSSVASAAAKPKRPKIDHRLLPRSEKRKFRHKVAFENIQYDYLGPNPLFGAEFELM